MKGVLIERALLGLSYSPLGNVRKLYALFF
jgi:hypothetical protein